MPTIHVIPTWRERAGVAIDEVSNKNVVNLRERLTMTNCGAHVGRSVIDGLDGGAIVPNKICLAATGSSCGMKIKKDD
jgi:hypothetical protein